jgi:hypothetical protein
VRERKRCTLYREMLLQRDPNGRRSQNIQTSQFFVWCESFSLTLRQEHRLKIPNRIPGPKKQGVKEAGKECIMKRYILFVLFTKYY